MRIATLVIVFFLNNMYLCAQVDDSSYITSTGERVLQMSIVIPVDREAAWDLFTKDSELVRWIAPVAHIELKTGGFILTNYDKSKSLSDKSSIRLGIVNYLEKELITLKVDLNDNFPGKIQKEDQHLQEIIQFIDQGGGNTRIVSSMIGWGSGEEWDKAYNFFIRGNTYTYEGILKLFH